MTPTLGSYDLLGQDLTEAENAKLTAFRNLHIGFAFQVLDLPPDFTDLGNVIFSTAVREGRETSSPERGGAICWSAWGSGDRISYPSDKLFGG